MRWNGSRLRPGLEVTFCVTKEEEMARPLSGLWDVRALSAHGRDGSKSSQACVGVTNNFPVIGMTMLGGEYAR